jgi:hypothetical protein
MMSVKHARQELEEGIQRDAQRYRWLRVSILTDEGMASLEHANSDPTTPEEIDAAIDAAMLKTPNGEVRGASRLAGEASSAEVATSTVVLGADRLGKD